jgi:hypothetical protein
MGDKNPKKLMKKKKATDKATAQPAVTVAAASAKSPKR